MVTLNITGAKRAKYFENILNNFAILTPKLKQKRRKIVIGFSFIPNRIALNNKYQTAFSGQI